MQQGFKAGSEARSQLHLEHYCSIRWLRAGLSGDSGLALQPALAPVTLPGLASSLPLTPSPFWPLLLLIVPQADHARPHLCLSSLYRSLECRSWFVLPSRINVPAKPF